MKENKIRSFLQDDLSPGEEICRLGYDRHTQRKRAKNAASYIVLAGLIAAGSVYAHNIMTASGNYDWTFIAVILVFAICMLAGGAVTLFRLIKQVECYAVTNERIIIKRYRSNPIRLEGRDLAKGGSYDAFSVYYYQIKTDENAETLLTDEEKANLKNYFTISYRENLILIKNKSQIPVDYISGKNMAEVMDLIESFVFEANR